MKTSLRLILLLNLILISTNFLYAISGNITSNTTWSTDQTVDGDITINSGVTLTIDPGVTIYFDLDISSNPTTMYIYGTLNAIGNTTSSIVFTEANYNIGWNGLVFDNGNQSSSTLQYCTISKALIHAVSIVSSNQLLIDNCEISYNSGTDGTAIYCSNSNPYISNNYIHENNSNNSGAGIYCSGSSPTIYHNYIEHCNSAISGGGIYCTSNSNPLIQQNNIHLNSSYNGGGIYVCANSAPEIYFNLIHENGAAQNGGGISCMGTSPFIHKNLIDSNSANIGGGSIYCTINSSPHIEQNNVYYNNSSDGGGIYLFSNSNAEIDNNLIHLNSATNNGGGIYCAGSSPEIHENLIDSNIANTKGGGAYFVSSTLDVNNDIQIVFNYSDNGAGIYLTNCSGTIADTGISYNIAGSTGGGIYLDQSSVNLQYCTINHNTSALGGGGVYLNEIISANIENCNIFHNQSETDGGGIYCNYSDPIIRNSCQIGYNEAERNGGGIFFYSSSPQIGDDNQNGAFNEIFKNISGERGGGIYGEEKSNTLIEMNHIWENVSHGDGGGIYLIETYWINYLPKIINNAITYNIADGDPNNSQGNGGGIYISDDNLDNSPFSLNNTIVYNYASNEGGGVYSPNYQGFFGNDIVYFNTAGIAYNNLNYYLWQWSIFASFSFCDIEGLPAWPPDSYGNFGDDPDFDAVAVGNPNIFFLSSVSPCIDKGITNALGWIYSSFDLNHGIRVYNGVIDIGCDEYSTNNILLSNNNIKNTIIDNFNIDIYPNPCISKTSILILMANKSFVSIKIMDLQGKILYQSRNLYDRRENIVNLNVVNFKKGMYICQFVNDNNNTITKKLFIK